MSQKYHSLPAEKVLEILQSDRQKGLSDEEAQKRRQLEGKNEISDKQQTAWYEIFFSQFLNPLMAVILAAAVISFLIGHVTDAWFILAVVFLNALVGFIQEMKTERALAVLRQALRFRARLLRSGRILQVDSAEVVVGDVLILRPGDRVPADARLLEAENLTVSEAALSGESQAVEKSAEILPADTPVLERGNMVWAGTTVEDGTALAVVTATGDRTRLGRIAEMISDAERRSTPLQKMLRKFSYRITAGILLAVAFFALLSFFRKGFDPQILISSVALVVSVIPEGLLPAVTVVLVVGVNRLARSKALVRRLSALETMGAVDVICMDKTGTLTTGEMRVSHVLAGFDPQQKTLREDPPADLRQEVLVIGMMASEATVADPEAPEKKWNISGRATDRALLLSALQAGLRRRNFLEKYSLLSTELFSSARKYAVYVFGHRTKNESRVFLLGAPEKVLARSSNIVCANGDRIHLDEKTTAKIGAQLERLTKRGYRVLAAAEKTVSSKSLPASEAASEMTFVGFVALKDPVRADSAEAIVKAHQAGVETMVITGDHRDTARAVLEEAGLHLREDEILTGEELEKMTDEELSAAVKKVKLFARVLPAQKIRIVRALQNNSHTVSMVGDGVNDAPALRQADVGIVVGSGTDLAKSVSDIVLLDDAFGTIVRAIKQGRHVFVNLRRIIVFLLADNFSILFLFFFALLFDLPLPLLAAQILWINVIEDGLPAMALTATRAGDQVMKMRPHSLLETLWSESTKRFMISVFAVTGLAAVLSFVVMLYLEIPLETIRTVLFVLMSLDSLVFAYVVATLESSIFSRDLWRQKYLHLASLISLILIVAGVYFPPLQALLQTVALSPQAWAAVAAITILETILFEIAKKRMRRREQIGSLTTGY